MSIEELLNGLGGLMWSCARLEFGCVRFEYISRQGNELRHVCEFGEL